MLFYTKCQGFGRRCLHADLENGNDDNDEGEKKGTNRCNAFENERQMIFVAGVGDDFKNDSENDADDGKKS